MNRYRFHANEDDWRPVTFPPPGPAWGTGYGDGYSVVVAFAESEDQILEYWPEAAEITVQENEPIKFTDRFPRPGWWPA
jgi:hypothetical protein